MLYDIEEVLEIDVVLREFDKLKEQCLLEDLDPISFKQYRDLHESLYLKEREYWEDIDPDIFDLIETHSETEFIMIRYLVSRLSCNY